MRIFPLNCISHFQFEIWYATQPSNKKLSFNLFDNYLVSIYCQLEKQRQTALLSGQHFLFRTLMDFFFIENKETKKCGSEKSFLKERHLFAINYKIHIIKFRLIGNKFGKNALVLAWWTFLISISNYRYILHWIFNEWKKWFALLSI